VLLLVLILVHQESHAATLTAAQAKNHVGENATVCGAVASATFAARSKGQPAFLNLDKPHPEGIFTALIWGSERSKFSHPEDTYKGKHICVTGAITLYGGVPQIVVTEPRQIREGGAAR
jgi:micrococcal nuclease